MVERPPEALRREPVAFAAGSCIWNSFSVLLARVASVTVQAESVKRKAVFSRPAHGKRAPAPGLH